MQEIIHSLPHFLAGLFIGCLGTFMIYLSWSLIAMGLKKPFAEASTLFFIVGVFAFAVVYLVRDITIDWPTFVGAAISVFFIGKSLLTAHDET